MVKTVPAPNLERFRQIFWSEKNGALLPETNI